MVLVCMMVVVVLLRSFHRSCLMCTHSLELIEHLSEMKIRTLNRSNNLDIARIVF